MAKKILNPFRCKFCKVPVISRDNHHPILGRSHKKSCPRHRSCN